MKLNPTTRNNVLLLTILANMLIGCNAGNNSVIETSKIEPLVTTAPQLTANYLIVASPKQMKVESFKVDENGDLIHVSDFPVAGEPGDVAVYKNRFLYFVENLAPDVAIAEIMPDGRLLAADGARGKTGYSPWSTHLAGDFAYTGNTNSYSISMFKLEAKNGAMAAIGQESINLNFSPSGISVNPNNNKFAYVAGYNSNTINKLYRNPETGILQLAPQKFQVGYAPRGIWFDNNNHAYVLEQMSNTIHQFVVESSGDLVPLQPATIATGSEPIAIVVSNKVNGVEYTYVASRGSNLIQVFRKNADGGLILQSSVKNCLMGPRSLTLDSQRQQLYVSNMLADNISRFPILANGDLDDTSCHKYYTGSDPEVIALVAQ